jgi:hypothetical protein
MTSIAFVHETAIINAQPTCGSSFQGQYCEYVKNDAPVRMHSAINT